MIKNKEVIIRKNKFSITKRKKKPYEALWKNAVIGYKNLLKK